MVLGPTNPDLEIPSASTEYGVPGQEMSIDAASNRLWKHLRLEGCKLHRQRIAGDWDLNTQLILGILDGQSQRH